MSYTVRWIRDDPPGEEGSQTFQAREEALEAARAVHGAALVVKDPAGSVIVLKDGHILEGAEATETALRFRVEGKESSPSIEDPNTPAE